MADFAKEVLPVNLEDEMRQSYLDYAMSVIVSRALPDVRDGLKPVHRRVLYAMYDGGYRPDRGFNKCSRVVGDVIGKYHPHGDSAVYDTIVRMAQPFAMRYMLVDGQGNFGSVDGDSPAAMRYTEVRMARIAQTPKIIARVIGGSRQRRGRHHQEPLAVSGLFVGGEFLVPRGLGGGIESGITIARGGGDQHGGEADAAGIPRPSSEVHSRVRPTAFSFSVPIRGNRRHVQSFSATMAAADFGGASGVRERAAPARPQAR